MSYYHFKSHFENIPINSLCRAWKYDPELPIDLQPGFLRFKSQTFSQFHEIYYKDIYKRILVVLKRKRQLRPHSPRNSYWAYRRFYKPLREQARLYNLPYATFRRRLLNKQIEPIYINDYSPPPNPS